MENRLRQMVAKIAETTPDFADSADLRDDLAIDSVRAFELLFEIEQAFGLRIPEARYADLVTFTDLVRVIRSLEG